MTVTVRRWEDPTSWNTFVSAVSDAHFQQSWEWGELARELGGRAVRLAAVCDNQLVGSAQVFINPTGGLGHTHLYIPRGPVLREPRLEVLGPLLDQARALGEDCRALGVRVEPNCADSDPAWPRLLQSLDFARSYPPSQPRSSWVLDITPDPDALLAAMKQKTRYNIRLAARKGIEVREGGEADLDRLWRDARPLRWQVRDQHGLHGRPFRPAPRGHGGKSLQRGSFGG